MGLLVIVLGLLAAVIVPVAAGRTTPGRPQAVPVPAPPAVGQCIGQSFLADWNAVGEEVKAYRYPELVVGDCDRMHFGEVVAVIAHPTTPEVQTQSGSSFVDDSNMETCGRAVAGFVQSGDPAEGREPPADGYWGPAAFPSVVALAPTNRQRAAGQQWLACGVYLTDHGQAGSNSTAVGYRNSLRSASSTGTGRDYLGYCPDEADWNQASSVSCRVPHHGEIFGLGALEQDTPRATLLTSCATMVAQATGNGALAGNGRLVLEVEATDQNGTTVEGSMVPKGASLQCGLLTTGGRLLGGSLIAIGGEPLPWA